MKRVVNALKKTFAQECSSHESSTYSSASSSSKTKDSSRPKRRYLQPQPRFANKTKKKSQKRSSRSESMKIKILEKSANRLKVLSPKQPKVKSTRTAKPVLGKPFPPVLKIIDLMAKGDKDKISMAVDVTITACLNCRYDYNFPETQSADKNRKFAALKSLVEYVMNNGNCDLPIDKPMARKLCNLISTHIFRPLMRTEEYSNPSGWDENNPFPMEKEPVWECLCIVYEILYYMLDSNTVQTWVLKDVITRDFVLSLINNLGSGDPDERGAVRYCLHRIYNNFRRMRRWIITRASFIFVQYAHEEESFNGIKELLELIGAAIAGFVVPIKPVNEQLFTQILLPLHKCRNYLYFAPELTYCICNFLTKEPRLAPQALSTIISYWPMQRAKKQICMSAVFQRYLKLTKEEHFVHVQKEVVHHIAHCIESYHMQVAENALMLWNEPVIATLITGGSDNVLEVMVPAVWRTSRNHWHDAVRSTAASLLDAFKKADPDVNRILDQYHAEAAKSKINRQKNLERWTYVERLAKNPRPIKIPAARVQKIISRGIDELGYKSTSHDYRRTKIRLGNVGRNRRKGSFRSIMCVEDPGDKETPGGSRRDMVLQKVPPKKKGELKMSKSSVSMFSRKPDLDEPTDSNPDNKMIFPRLSVETEKLVFAGKLPPLRRSITKSAPVLNLPASPTQADQQAKTKLLNMMKQILKLEQKSAKN